MAKANKVWRVLDEFDGRVTFEQECKHVVLSNKLTQQELSAIAENPAALAFMKQTTQPVNTNGEG